jgi:hypothetical protein
MTVLGVGLGLFAAGCSDDDGGGAAGPTGTLVEEFQYSVSGDVLVVTYPQTIETVHMCIDDSLITFVDTSEAETDSMPYTLDGNTFQIMVDSETLLSGAVVDYWYTYARQGSGSGLEGTWRLTGVSYTVVSGQLTPAEQDDLDAEITEEMEDIAEGWIEELVVGANTVSLYVSAPYADMIIGEMLDNIDTADYDLTITKVNNTTVRIRGNISGETVTISMNPATGDVTWTSTSSEHARHVYYSDPLSCPNEYAPEWIMLFMMQNYTGVIQKMTQPRFSAPVLPLSLFDRTRSR